MNKTELNPTDALYCLEDVILILEEENPESAARIMESVAADLQDDGWSVLRTPNGAYITFSEGMEHFFLPCSKGYAMKVYSSWEGAHVDALHHMPEYQ